MPKIFSYNNYRHFLGDFYREKKAANKAYSYRVFNDAAGIKSPSFFKLVVEGKRSLSPKGVESFLKALKLKVREAQYFQALVKFNHATTLEERERCYRQLAFFKEREAVKELAAHQYRFYSHWYNVAVLEMTKVAGFREDPKWISKKLVPKITEDEARDALFLLKELGLVIKDKSLRLVATDKNVTTEAEVFDISVANFQSEMIRRADAALWEDPGDARDVSSVTIALDEASFREAKRRIQEFRRELNVILSAVKNPDRVCQINFQLFHLTEKAGTGRKK